VNEDVFAYSNRAWDHRALVIYHNRFASTSGWIKDSTSFAVKTDSGTELRRTDLGHALGLKGDGRHYYIFRDYADGLEYIRNGRELCSQGFHIGLGPYDYHVFLDFREIWDDEYGTWGKLCHQLEGRPVADMDDEVKQVRYGELIDIFRQHIEHSASILTGEFEGLSPEDLSEQKEKFASAQLDFLAVLASTAGLAVGPEAALPAIIGELEYLEMAAAKEWTILDGFTSKILAFVWLALHRTGELAEDTSKTAADIVHEFGLARPLEEELGGEAAAEDDSLAKLDVASVMALFRIILKRERFLGLSLKEQSSLVPELLEDRNVALFIGLHRSGGHTWFIKERWEMMLEWLEFVAEVSVAGAGKKAKPVKKEGRLLLVRAAKEAGYRADLFLKGVGC
jgi:hypothetical protein